jgi:hypothetical protein
MECVRKGKQVNIPVRHKYTATKVLFPTLRGRLSQLVCCVNQRVRMEYRNDEKFAKAGNSIPTEYTADPRSP